MSGGKQSIDRLGRFTQVRLPEAHISEFDFPEFDGNENLLMCSQLMYSGRDRVWTSDPECGLAVGRNSCEMQL
jgi:hypothetical protein